MNKALKIFLIGLVAIFIFGILGIGSVQAQNPNDLIVEYWTGTEWKPLQGPIFSETNFLPGQSVTRSIRVTNNSGQPQRVAAEAINYPGFVSGSPRPHPIPDKDLSRALLIIIREKGGGDLYGGSTGQKYLYDFYQNGETYLSDISNGGIKEYEFEITFPSEKENDWQEKTTNFDILVGFQGVEGQVSPGGGGGGGLPPGLTIQYERYEVGTTTAKISWSTSYKSTSRVIYDTVSGVFNLNILPNYGYRFSTPEYHTPANTNGVTSHEVILTGLTPGTTYYYRCVSHASPPTISREHSFTTYSFTTLGVKPGEKIEEEIPSVEIPPYEEEIPTEEVVLAPSKEEIIPLKEIIPPEEEVVVSPEEMAITPPEEKLPERGLASMLAGIGMVIGGISQSAWKMIVVILSLIGLILIGIREWKRRKEKEK